MQLESRLNDLLQRRQANNSLRRPAAYPDKIDFSSNDYLGLARDAALRQRIEKAYLIHCQGDTYRLGATGSRLLTGHSALHEALETQLADFHQAEAALLFNSGYDANLGILPAVTRKTDLILYDELIHASLHDAMKLCDAQAVAFRHNDLAALEALLQTHQPTQKGVIFIVVESIYSMDGDACPLVELTQLAEKYQAYIYVDEAHSTGILGKHGEGLAQALGVQDKIWARLHTFGKAIGAHGAVVVGNATLKNYLLNYARSLIYTTSLPTHTLIAIQQVYLYLQTHGNFYIKQLNERIHFFKEYAQQLNLGHLLDSDSPIQICITPTNQRARQLAQMLQTSGFDVRAILSPTVPAGQERLRICLHAYNTNEEIKQLLELIAQ